LNQGTSAGFPGEYAASQIVNARVTWLDQPPRRDVAHPSAATVYHDPGVFTRQLSQVGVDLLVSDAKLLPQRVELLRRDLAGRQPPA
jgi:hypothetical protein